ncbi:hypothetical protein [Rhizobium etli]|uniref:Uncharacterized protein n=1 Tax=Rhizobium etli TaxID=29449 RepID=A0A7W6V6A0_RHIET|nr:hypothetical protein [Rhizobium etli]MBB4478440.1 hypothetical protein [Rhizobium etli]MBB4534272.1 hypothetical protein [Rhizobium etli]
MGSGRVIAVICTPEATNQSRWRCKSPPRTGISGWQHEFIIAVSDKWDTAGKLTRAEAQLKISNSPQRVSRIKPLLRHAAGLSFGIVLELRRQLLRRLRPCAPVVRLRPAVGLIKLGLAEIVPISDPQRFIDPAGIDPSSDRDVGNIAVSFSNLPPREIFLRHKRASCSDTNETLTDSLQRWRAVGQTSFY